MQALLTLLLTAPLLAPAQEATAPAAPIEPIEPATLLRLYDGGILWGRIDAHGAEGLDFVRLDNGGRVHLPWTLLDPVQAEELLEAYGYVDHSEEELTIEADRLVLDNGLEWVGRIVNRTQDEIWLKTASELVRVPKLRLRGAATLVQVPALEVYTGDELYQQELARLVEDSAESHFELARFCERVLEFDRAVEHYRRAGELDPQVRPDELANRLALAEDKARNRAQVEYLREIDSLRQRNRFDQALANALAFPELFPDSSLAPDASRKVSAVERDRERALRDRTRRAWHAWAGRMAQQKGRDTEMTVDSVIAWIEEGMSEEVLAAVHKELSATVSQSVTPEEIQRYWIERKGSRSHKASYGEGTWLLGPQAARAGMAEEEVDLAKLSESERERARIEDRVRRYLQNQTAVRSAAKMQGGEEDERDEFWSRWNALERKQWVLAYYAEKSGDMRVLRFDLSNCKDCGGSGVREVININSVPSRPGQQGGGGNVVEKIACPLCRNVGVVRRVVYR